jgi:hypothetical protein
MTGLSFGKFGRPRDAHHDGTIGRSGARPLLSHRCWTVGDTGTELGFLEAMRQLVQSVRSGELTIVEAPDPLIGPTEVLVQTTHSVVSAGTERAVRELASASLLQKAKARPDLVRQVIRKAREDGIRATTNAVRARLDDDMPLGYSGAGVVLEVGEAVRRSAGHARGNRWSWPWGPPGRGRAARRSGPGQRGRTRQAAFATVASIALHGFRLADVGPGGSVCVVGLGLIGQLTAAGSGVGSSCVGVDLRSGPSIEPSSAGAVATVEQGDATTSAIVEWSRGRACGCRTADSGNIFIDTRSART